MEPDQTENPLSTLHNEMAPAEGSKGLPFDDPDARALVRAAHEHMYKWPVDFPGYEAALTVNEEGRSGGDVWLVPRRETIVELPGASDVFTDWVRERLRTQGMYLAWIPFEQGDGKSLLSFALEDEPGRCHPRGRKVLLTGGRLESWYRIKDHRYMQIGRLTPMTEGCINTIERYGSALDGRFCASYSVASPYVMTYFTLDGDAVIGMESDVNDYAEIQGVWLPLR
jgi:hypothetical protein